MQTDSLVITKNWRMDGLSSFLRYGASLVCALRARGASSLSNDWEWLLFLLLKGKMPFC